MEEPKSSPSVGRAQLDRDRAGAIWHESVEVANFFHVIIMCFMGSNDILQYPLIRCTCRPYVTILLLHMTPSDHDDARRVMKDE